MVDSIKEFIETSKKVLSTDTNQYNKYSTEIIKYLESILKISDCKSCIVQSRIKNPDSLSEKVYRKNYHIKYSSPQLFINSLPDVIGARILCLLNIEENRIYDFLYTYFIFPEEIDNILFSSYSESYDKDKLLINFSNQPQKQKNGHDIYRLDCKWFDSSTKSYINVELQIKSLVHYFWGELDHMLFYKNYSYLVSSSFYSDLMDSINYELENIDQQLLIIRNQIDKTDQTEVNEIKQIASLILYNNYNSDVVNTLDCKIDLREVFDLLVDINFKNIGSKQLNYQHLQSIIRDIHGKKLNNDYLLLIEPGKINESEHSQRTIALAKTIDKTLKKKDIFWIFFYVIYSSQYIKESENNYNTIIKKICDDLLSMIRVFEDNIERIDDDCDDLYDDFINSIYHGIFEAFNNNPKLNFFIYNVNFSKITKIAEVVVIKCQHKISSKNREQIARSLQLLTYYIKCNIIIATDDKIDVESVLKLISYLQKEDFFELSFDSIYYDEITQVINNTNLIEKDIFYRLFPREGE